MFSWLMGKKKFGLPSDYRKYIDQDALTIVDQLERAGFETYLVGGCVRDVLLRKKPKDFDIATKASPQQVKAIVKRSFIIGKRFRIVVAKRRWRHNEGAIPEHGLFPYHLDTASEKEFQITTFRRDPVVVNGVVNENVFGTAKDDAQRRDFTINALFLEPVNGKIVDLVGGMDDLKNKILRVIGDPAERFREDPIRILRALRFVARADLKMDRGTANAFETSVALLADAKKERTREEILKCFKEGSAERVLKELHRVGAWKHLNPEFGRFLEAHPKSYETLVKIAARCKALPWTHPRNAAPLFFLILRDAMDALGAESAKISAIEEGFKLSKAEKEEAERIRHTLQKILRDPQAKNAGRVLASDARYHAHLVGTFYCLKILADTGLEPFKSAWSHWEKPWKERVTRFSQDRRSASPASPAASSSGRRGSGRRRRGGSGRRGGMGASPSPAAARSTSSTGSGSSGGGHGSGGSDT